MRDAKYFLEQAERCFRLARSPDACFGNGNWNPVPPRGIVARMAGYAVIRITERLGGGEPLRTAYAVAEPNQHRAIALFKLKTGSHRRRTG